MKVTLPTPWEDGHPSGSISSSCDGLSVSSCRPSHFQVGKDVGLANGKSTILRSECKAGTSPSNIRMEACNKQNNFLDLQTLGNVWVSQWSFQTPFKGGNHFSREDEGPGSWLHGATEAPSSFRQLLQARARRKAPGDFGPRALGERWQGNHMATQNRLQPEKQMPQNRNKNRRNGSKWVIQPDTCRIESRRVYGLCHPLSGSLWKSKKHGKWFPETADKQLQHLY